MFDYTIFRVGCYVPMKQQKYHAATSSPGTAEGFNIICSEVVQLCRQALQVHNRVMTLPATYQPVVKDVIQHKYRLYGFDKPVIWITGERIWIQKIGVSITSVVFLIETNHSQIPSEKKQFPHDIALVNLRVYLKRCVVGGLVGKIWYCPSVCLTYEVN